MTERYAKRRMTTLVGAAAATLLALTGVGTAANAAVTDFGNIDGDRTGSLTVHKYLHQSSGSAGSPTGDISEATPGFSDPVDGVVFTAYELLKDGGSVDLTIPASWEGLAELEAGENCVAPDGYTLGAPVPLPATSGGSATSSGLPVGLYQVCETSVENATVDGKPVTITDTAPPFILTVPMPHELGWVYDVHAYPKNGDSNLVKTIDPQGENGLGVGSQVTFPVLIDIPKLGEGKTWTSFGVSDVYDERLKPVDPYAASVTLDGAALDESFYTVIPDGQTVIVKFTQAGLDFLNTTHNGQSGKTLEVVFVTEVLEIGDGTVENTAGFWPNNPDFENDDVDYEEPDVPSNVVETHWGDLQVIKRGAGTEGAEGLLKGARFQVYDAVDPYADDCSVAQKTGDPIVVDGVNEFESNDNGRISIAGLFVSDSESAPVNAAERCYVLVETVAPAGYVLPDNAETGVAVKIGQTATGAELEIENTQAQVPELPLTGGSGQILLITGGIAAVAIAAGLMLMNRRRESVETQ